MALKEAALIKTWLVVALLACATTAHASDEVPADEAQIDRLLEAFPRAEPDAADAASDAEYLSLLQARNPGRTDEVRQLLETQKQCEATVVRTWTREGFLEIGRRMGRAKIELLIQFYSGPDSREFMAINARSERGEPRSQADRATIDRIMREYPLMEMAETMQSDYLTPDREPNLIESFEECLAERNTAFERAGLRQVTD